MRALISASTVVGSDSRSPPERTAFSSSRRNSGLPSLRCARPSITWRGSGCDSVAASISSTVLLRSNGASSSRTTASTSSAGTPLRRRVMIRIHRRPPTCAARYSIRSAVASSIQSASSMQMIVGVGHDGVEQFDDRRFEARSCGIRRRGGGPRPSRRSRVATGSRPGRATARDQGTGRRPAPPTERSAAPQWSPVRPSSDSNNGAAGMYGVSIWYSRQAVRWISNPSAAPRNAVSRRLLPAPGSATISKQHPLPSTGAVHRCGPSTHLLPPTDERQRRRVDRLPNATGPSDGVCSDGIALALHVERLEFGRLEERVGTVEDRRCREHLVGCRLRHDPCRQVHRIAHDGVVASEDGADLTREHGPGVDADPEIGPTGRHR